MDNNQPQGRTPSGNDIQPNGPSQSDGLPQPCGPPLPSGSQQSSEPQPYGPSEYPQYRDPSYQRGDYRQAPLPQSRDSTQKMTRYYPSQGVPGVHPRQGVMNNDRPQCHSPLQDTTSNDVSQGMTNDYSSQVKNRQGMADKSYWGMANESNWGMDNEVNWGMDTEPNWGINNEIKWGINNKSLPQDGPASHALSNCPEQPPRSGCADQWSVHSTTSNLSLDPPPFFYRHISYSEELEMPTTPVNREECSQNVQSWLDEMSRDSATAAENLGPRRRSASPVTRSASQAGKSSDRSFRTREAPRGAHSTRRGGRGRGGRHGGGRPRPT